MLETLRRAAIACALAFLAASPLRASADTTQYVSHAAQAPMDEYFGKLEMSPLGVENAIALASARAESRDASANSVAKSLTFVEDSVRDWEAKFPKDRWLPRMLLSIKHVYRKCGDDGCRRNEMRLGTWLLLRYPESKEARAVVHEALAAAPRPLAAVVAATQP